MPSNRKSSEPRLPHSPDPVAGEEEKIRTQFLATFREALDDHGFSDSEDFLAAGGDSLTVTEIILEIEEQFGVSISIGEFMALGSASKLTRHIISSDEYKRTLNDTGGAGPEPLLGKLVSVQEGGLRPPIVVAHGLWGNGGWAMKLPDYLPENQPISTLFARTDPLLARGVLTLSELADDYAQSVDQEFQGTPVALVGFSLGAHVAVALGNALSRRNNPPSIVVVLDDEADLDKRNFGASNEHIEPKTSSRLLKQSLKISPVEPISAHILYFRSGEMQSYYRSDATSGWGEIATGGVTVVDAPCRHLEFVSNTTLAQIGPRIAEEISRSRPDAPPPDSMRMQRFEARCAARRGDLDAELSLLQAIIEQDREQPSWLYANRAEALFQNNDVPMALQAISEARQRDQWPLNIDLRFLKLFKQQKLDLELKVVSDRLASLRFDHPSVHEQAAQAYSLMDRYEEAEHHARAGLAKQPEHFRLSLQLCKCLRRKGDWQELFVFTERLLENSPTENTFRSAHIDACVKIGHPERALRFLEELRKTSANATSSRLSMAKALLSCGRPHEALEFSKHVISNYPGNRKANMVHNQTLKRLGRLDGTEETGLHASANSKSRQTPSSKWSRFRALWRRQS